MVAAEAYAVLALLVVVLVCVVLLSLYYLRRYRLQRLRSLREEGSGPAQAGDRAYNRLALARREADLLAAQGGDVDRARQLIDLAERSLDHREFDRAYELAQSAHETLVKARREPRSARAAPTAPPDPLLATGPTTGSPALPSTPPRAAPSGETPADPAAKSRAEAQFQLHLFEEDLARASKGSPTGPALTEARGLYVQAHAAYARAEFLEAFRLALRGRRRIGGQIESLGGPTGPPRPPPSGAASPDAAESAEELAGHERCPQCGHPTVAGDAFCRGCGAARGPSVCPRCGAPRLPRDTFCGRCGERYAVLAA